MPMLRDMGDDATAEVMDAIEADEIQHVRFANEWLKRLTGKIRAALMEIAAAMAETKRIAAALAPRPGEKRVDGGELDRRCADLATSQEDRSLAGFSDREILELLRRDERALAAVHGRYCGARMNRSAAERRPADPAPRSGRSGPRRALHRGGALGGVRQTSRTGTRGARSSSSIGR